MEALNWPTVLRYFGLHHSLLYLKIFCIYFLVAEDDDQQNNATPNAPCTLFRQWTWMAFCLPIFHFVCMFTTAYHCFRYHIQRPQSAMINFCLNEGILRGQFSDDILIFLFFVSAIELCIRNKLYALWTSSKETVAKKQTN